MEPSCTCLIKLKTELIWTLSNFYAAQKQDYCSKNSKCSCSWVRGCGRNGKLKKQHSNNWKSDSTSFYMTSDFYLSTWTCWNTELQWVQVNQCQFCVLKPKKNLALPSFLVVCSCSLFSTCLDCFMILALTHHECVILFIKCFCPISLCFTLCLVLLFWSGKLSW